MDASKALIRTRMLGFSLCLLLLGSMAVAREVPFIGIVQADIATLRAGGGESYYLVGQAKKNQLVQVEEVIWGWYKIVPPKGAFSYIEKSLVDLAANGRTGRVNRDRASVKAGSTEPRAVVEDSWRTQVNLAKGSPVMILGLTSTHYKIAPPPNAFVYVQAASVGRATEAQIAAITDEPVTQGEAITATVDKAHKTQKVVAPAVQKVADEPKVESKITTKVESQSVLPIQKVTAKVKSPPPHDVPVKAAKADAHGATAPHVTQSVVTDSPPAADEHVVTQHVTATKVATTAVTQTVEPVEPQAVKKPLTFAEVEKRFNDASRKPVEHQPINELAEAYVTLTHNKGLTDGQKSIVRSRITQLQRSAQVRNAIMRVSAARLGKVRTVSDGAGGAGGAGGVQMQQPIYRAVGQLLVSTVFNGDKLPRLYRLVEPSQMRTIAYISAEPNVDVRPALGKLVGIVGSTDTTRRLKLRVIRANRVDVLASATR